MSATVIIFPRNRLKSSLHPIRAVSLRCTNGLLVMASPTRHATNHRHGIGSRCMCLSRRRRRCLARYVTVAWLLRAFESNYPRVLWYHRSSAYGSMTGTAMSLCARPNIVYRPILTSTSSLSSRRRYSYVPRDTVRLSAFLHLLKSLLPRLMQKLLFLAQPSPSTRAATRR